MSNSLKCLALFLSAGLELPTASRPRVTALYFRSSNALKLTSHQGKHVLIIKEKARLRPERASMSTARYVLLFPPFLCSPARNLGANLVIDRRLIQQPTLQPSLMQ
ncbi:hypothetical protein RRG08_025760 [Elysia crispata]|uniref:Secreted protein n=1 Tax=Elysia crispata TaxID=231223 RepID=A0AAE1DZN6_9GAST|nr:hypothetical protein RRG08_025760 [Elysia crispata]